MVSSLHIYLQLLCIISRCQIKFPDRERSRLQRKCMYRDDDIMNLEIDLIGGAFTRNPGGCCASAACCLWGVIVVYLIL